MGMRLALALAPVFLAAAVSATETREDALARARALAMDSRYGEAVDALGAIVRAAPEDRAAHELLAFCLMKLERWDEACAAFERGDPADRYHGVNHGYSLRKAGRPLEARRALAAAAAALGEGESWRRFCEAELAELAPLEGARVVLALAQADDGAVALVNGRPCARARGGGEAFLALDRLLVPGKNEVRAVAHNARGGWAWRARLYMNGKEAFVASAREDDRAIGVVAEATIEIVKESGGTLVLAAARETIDRADARARAQRAEDLAAAGRRGEALAALAEAGRRYPSLEWFPRREAEIHEEAGAAIEGRNARARFVEVRRRAAALAPEDAGALAALGAAYAECGRLADAEKAFRRAAALDPASGEAWAGLAAVRARLGDAGEALELAAEALARAPDSPVARAARGDALLAAGDAAGAIAAYEAARASDPAGAAWARAKIVLAARRGAPAGAGATSGEGYLRALRFADAADAFVRALDANPATPRAAALGGLAAELAGDRVRAEALYERAGRDDPLADLARRRLARARSLHAIRGAGGAPDEIAGAGRVPIEFAAADGDAKARLGAAIDALEKIRPVLAAGLRALPPLRDGRIGEEDARAAERIRALAIRARSQDSRRALALIEREIRRRPQRRDADGHRGAVDGALDEWGPGDTIAEDPAGDAAEGALPEADLVALGAVIDRGDLHLALRTSAPPRPDADCAYWAQIYPLRRDEDEAERPWIAVGIAGGEPVLRRFLPGGKREERRGAASGIEWRAGAALEARVPLSWLGGERRLRVEAYSWSERARGRLDTIAAAGAPPRVDDGYAPALLALFHIAQEVEPDPEDRVMLAVALASGDLYALGDRRVQEAVRDDDRRMVRFARALKVWQKKNGLPPLADQPLAPLLFWASRVARARPHDAESYRRESIAPATLEALLRRIDELAIRGPPGEVVERIERYLVDPARRAYASRETAARGGRLRDGGSVLFFEDERVALRELIRPIHVDGRATETDRGLAPDLLCDLIATADVLPGDEAAEARATVELCRAVGIPAAVVESVDEKAKLFPARYPFTAYWDGGARAWRFVDGGAAAPAPGTGARPPTLFWPVPGGFRPPAAARPAPDGGYRFPARSAAEPAGAWWDRWIATLAD